MARATSLFQRLCSLALKKGSLLGLPEDALTGTGGWRLLQVCLSPGHSLVSDRRNMLGDISDRSGGPVRSRTLLAGEFSVN